MNKELFYDTIAEDFDSIMNTYDLNRRIEVIFTDFLGNESTRGKSLLDGGCGTGFFTKKALAMGFEVTSVDISPKLIDLTKKKNPAAKTEIASLLNLPFEDNTFDYVISSDVIEHTSDPFGATKELIRVLKPGGKICITVPNKSVWFFSVVIANLLKIRSYQGFENWVHYYKFEKFLESNNININIYKGVHLFPFVFSFLNSILYKMDRIVENKLGVLMVVIAACGTKNDYD